MWSLRTRFTALLVISVVLVLVIAAFVTATLLRKPPEAMFDRALAEKAELTALLLRADPSVAEKMHIRIRERGRAFVQRRLSDGNQCFRIRRRRTAPGVRSTSDCECHLRPTESATRPGIGDAGNIQAALVKHANEAAEKIIIVDEDRRWMIADRKIKLVRISDHRVAIL